MSIYRLNGISPRISESAWVADSAQIIGAVELSDDVSVWFCATLRGDMVVPVRVGRGSNIQDSCVLHSDEGFPLAVGENVTVGHRVVLHGCTIANGTLIGIGAIILNGANIGRNCLVGAGALVTENKVFADGCLILGSPAAAKRNLTPEELHSLRHAGEHYVVNARRFRAGIARLDWTAKRN